MIAAIIGLLFILGALIGFATDKPLTAWDALMLLGMSLLVSGLSSIADKQTLR